MDKVPSVNHVITFDLNSGEGIRVAFDVDNGVGFCLNDICEVLSLDRRETRRSLSDEDIFQHRAPTDGGWQWMTFLTSDSLRAILNRLALGRVMPLINELTEWVIPAIIYHMDNEWGEQEDEESLAEATFHKFDETSNQSTEESTEASTDMSTEVATADERRPIILVINLK